MKQMWNGKAYRIAEGVGVALLGILALCFPDGILGFLGWAIGIVMLACGVLQVIRAVSGRGSATSAVSLIFGLAFAALGLTVLVNPATPVWIFAAVVGLWALVTGAFRMNEAIARRQAGFPFAWPMVQSFIHIAFGFFMLVNPWGGTALWLRVIGGYLIYLGIVFLVSVVADKD
jgi:uncharacterized membrane protein HdeD (DUF308 family)